MASKKKAVEQDAKRQAFMDEFMAGQGAGEEWEAVVSGKNLKLGINESVEGIIRRTPYAAGKSHAIDMEVDTGEEIEVVTYWSPTILTNLLKKINEGDHIIITRLDDISTANGEAHDFAVLRKKRS